MPNAPKKNIWDAAQLSISFGEQEMYIYGERILKCADATAGACATSQAALADHVYWPN